VADEKTKAETKTKTNGQTPTSKKQGEQKQTTPKKRGPHSQQPASQPASLSRKADRQAGRQFAAPTLRKPSATAARETCMRLANWRLLLLSNLANRRRRLHGKERGKNGRRTKNSR
jgi:hypothetical protein